MTALDPRLGSTTPQDWTALAAEDLVTVIEPWGLKYEALIEDKTRDSDVVWIRRTDIGSRHLIERHDGIRIVRRPAPPSETGGRQGAPRRF